MYVLRGVRAVECRGWFFPSSQHLMVGVVGTFAEGVSGETQGRNPSPASLCPSKWMVGWGRHPHSALYGTPPECKPDLLGTCSECWRRSAGGLGVGF